MLLRIDILTIFPQMFNGVFQESIIKVAKEKKIVQIFIHNLRDFAKDKHRTTDDYPYGGGPGMIMKVEPIYFAVKHILKDVDSELNSKIILLSPQGELYTQQKAGELAKEQHLVFICGHYKAIDERVKKLLDTYELSIGDYILTGGELAAMVVVDSVVRLLPGY